MTTKSYTQNQENTFENVDLKPFVSKAVLLYGIPPSNRGEFYKIPKNVNDFSLNYNNNPYAYIVIVNKPYRYTVFQFKVFKNTIELTEKGLIFQDSKDNKWVRIGLEFGDNKNVIKSINITIDNDKLFPTNPPISISAFDNLKLETMNIYDCDESLIPEN